MTEIVVSGSYVSEHGSPMTGWVRFTPKLLVPGVSNRPAVTAALGPTGAFSVRLQSTDSTWVYFVTEDINDIVRTYELEVASSNIDLPTVAPVTFDALVEMVEEGGGGGGAVSSVDGQTGVVDLSSSYQPKDSDLTAIAALTTTSFGRSVLALADAAAGRTAWGLGTAATQASGAFDAAGAAAAAQAASQPVDADLTAIAALTTTSFGRSLLALADAAAAITTLGLASVYQPLDSDLTSIAALTTTSIGRSLLAGADAAALRTIVGAVIGTNVQAWDADLDAVAALTTTTYGRSLLTLADAAAGLTSFGAAIALVPTAVKTSAYTAAASDYVPVDTTSGAVTVTLPSAPADKTRIGVKHVIQAGTNIVTVAAGGSDVFNKTSGSTSITLPLLNQSYMLQYKSSSAIWYVQSSDVPLSQLDARYNIFPETVVAGGNTSTAKTIASPTSAGGIVTYTLTGNCTFTMPTAVAGHSFTVYLFTGAGSFTATFTSVHWPSATAPTITATASRHDILTFTCVDGSTWDGFVSGQNYS